MTMLFPSCPSFPSSPSALFTPPPTPYSVQSTGGGGEKREKQIGEENEMPLFSVCSVVRSDKYIYICMYVCLCASN